MKKLLAFSIAIIVAGCTNSTFSPQGGSKTEANQGSNTLNYSGGYFTQQGEDLTHCGNGANILPNSEGASPLGAGTYTVCRSAANKKMITISGMGIPKSICIIPAYKNTEGKFLAFKESTSSIYRVCNLSLPATTTAVNVEISPPTTSELPDFNYLLIVDYDNIDALIGDGRVEGSFGCLTPEITGKTCPAYSKGPLP